VRPEGFDKAAAAPANQPPSELGTIAGPYRDRRGERGNGRVYGSDRNRTELAGESQGDGLRWGSVDGGRVRNTTVLLQV
jgi:hypothetical protein